MEQHQLHHGFEFVPGGGEIELPPHYVRKARTQTIVRCTQRISHTQMNTALCACGVSWKVSSRTGRGYNQTGGYGSVIYGYCHRYLPFAFSTSFGVGPLYPVNGDCPWSGKIAASLSQSVMCGLQCRCTPSVQQRLWKPGRVCSGHGWVRVVL